MLLGVLITGMPLTVAAAVLGSAVLHATWNAAAKSVPQRLLASLLIGIGSLVFGATWVLVATIPAGPAWPYLVASALLQTGYILLLTAAYAHGEFRHMYPLARGTAPVVVTVFSLAVLGEHLALWQILGVALVVAALGVLVAGAGARRGHGSPRSGYLLALATGLVIGSYTLVDGLGVRVSGSDAGYAAWQMLIHGSMVIAVCLALARRRMGPWLAQSGRPVRVALTGIAGGILSGIAYAIVLWAQAHASLSLVSALRETSVLFAGVIGAAIFHERLTARQMLAAAGVVVGIVLIQAG